MDNTEFDSKYRAAVTAAIDAEIRKLGLDVEPGADNHFHGNALGRITLCFRLSKDSAGFVADANKRIRNFPCDERLVNAQTAQLAASTVRSENRVKDSATYTYKDAGGAEHTVTYYNLMENYLNAVTKAGYNAILSAMQSQSTTTPRREGRL